MHTHDLGVAPRALKGSCIKTHAIQSGHDIQVLLLCIALADLALGLANRPPSRRGCVLRTHVPGQGGTTLLQHAPGPGVPVGGRPGLGPSLGATSGKELSLGLSLRLGRLSPRDGLSPGKRPPRVLGPLPWALGSAYVPPGSVWGLCPGQRLGPLSCGCHSVGWLWAVLGGDCSGELL